MKIEDVRGMTPDQLAEQLVTKIFQGCGLPAACRAGPGDGGVDVDFATDDAHGSERFAVQVKTTKRPVSQMDVATIAGLSLAQE